MALPVLNEQVYWTFILAIPVACISWTVTHEEIFKSFRTFCEKKIRNSRNAISRKFFYIFTCEYCFSHYIAILILLLAKFTLLLPGWKGAVIAGFSLVWIANIYMSIYAFLRQDIKKVKKEIEHIEND